MNQRKGFVLFEQEWFTPKEAAAFLERSTKYVQRKRASGLLKPHLLVMTDLWRYRRSTLVKFMATFLEDPSPPTDSYQEDFQK